jgi:hypothetical protein
MNLKKTIMGIALIFAPLLAMAQNWPVTVTDLDNRSVTIPGAAAHHPAGWPRYSGAGAAGARQSLCQSGGVEQPAEKTGHGNLERP